jgi:hypothetical protein
MLKVLYRHAINLPDSLLKLIVLILIAGPVTAMPQARSNLNRDSSINGYTLKRSNSRHRGEIIGAHQETSDTSPLLNGKQQVVVTLDNGRTIKRMVTFKNGSAIFGRILNVKGSVMVVCPCN